MPMGELLVSYYPYHEVKVYYHELSRSLLLMSPYFGDVIITVGELEDIVHQLLKRGIEFSPKPLDKSKTS